METRPNRVGCHGHVSTLLYGVLAVVCMWNNPKRLRSSSPSPQNCEPQYTHFLPLSCFFSGNWEREWINQASESRDALSCHFELCSSHLFMGGQSLLLLSVPIAVSEYGLLYRVTQLHTGEGSQTVFSCILSLLILTTMFQNGSFAPFSFLSRVTPQRLLAAYCTPFWSSVVTYVVMPVKLY